jgi:hypothetical protein
MHGPPGLFWVDLTTFSLQACGPTAEAELAEVQRLSRQLSPRGEARRTREAARRRLLSDGGAGAAHLLRAGGAIFADEEAQAARHGRHCYSGGK